MEMSDPFPSAFCLLLPPKLTLFVPVFFLRSRLIPPLPSRLTLRICGGGGGPLLLSHHPTPITLPLFSSASRLPVPGRNQCLICAPVRAGLVGLFSLARLGVSWPSGGCLSAHVRSPATQGLDASHGEPLSLCASTSTIEHIPLQ